MGGEDGAEPVREVDGHELRAVGVVLPRDPEQRDGAHEAGHEGEGHWRHGRRPVCQHVLVVGPLWVMGQST